MRLKKLILSLYCFCAASAFAQVSPEIEILTPDVCIPGKVTVRIKNCASCQTIEWELGSGSGLKLGPAEYSTILTTSGWIDVSAKLKTTAGQIIYLSVKNGIFGRKSPSPSFTVSDSVFCVKADSVTITDKTPNIVSRDWLIEGDVFYDAPKVLKYKFSGTTGYKGIYLLVRDSWNCKGKILKDSAIALFDSLKLNAIASKQTGCAPAFIDFISDIDTGLQSIKSVQWTFQGGLPTGSTLRNPKNIQYKKGDTFDVFFTANTKQGCRYNYKLNNFISLGDTAFLTITAPKTKFCVNEKLTLKVGGAKTPFQTWDFTPVPYSIISHVDSLITVRFTDTGNLFATVSENDRGCVSNATYSSKFVVDGPKARFESEDAFYCTTPATLDFTNTSIEWPGGTTYKWSIFKHNTTSGTTTTTKNLSYGVSGTDNWDVKLVATGSNGCVDSVETQNASVFGKINVDFTIQPYPVCPGSKVSLIPKAGPGTTTNPHYFKWSFYDENGNVVYNSSDKIPGYTYNKTGRFSAKMVIWNNNQCKDSAFLKDTIWVNSPVLNLEIKDSMVCKGEKVTLLVRGRPTGKKYIPQWRIKNLDSATDDVYGSADSFVTTLRKTGRWQVTYSLTDTSKGGCTTKSVLASRIFVSGVTYKISQDVQFGCAPLKVNLTATQQENVNYESSGSSTFLWKHPPWCTVNFNDSTLQNPLATMGKGDQTVYLVYKNASGCVDSSSTLYARSGIQSNFYAENTPPCVGKSIQLYNGSSSWIDSLKYICADPSVIFSPSKNVASPKIVCSKAGYFPTKLVTFYKGCTDTFNSSVRANEIIASFYTPDSVSYCAPRLVNFINESKGALYNYWDFGDGTDSVRTLFDDLAGHLYLKNNGNPGYTITLIAEDNLGCRDTLTRKAYLRIVGPIPDFSVSNISGCEPLNVQFKNDSRDFSRMFLDYDNGIVLDSILLLPHKYRVTDKSQGIQKFLPRLLLYDSFGCSALAFSRDSISVYKNAEAKYIFNSVNFLRGTEGCANDLLVKFENKSQFYTKISWDFNQDWVTDIVNQNKPSYLYDIPGVFKPILIAEHANGCKDTLMKDSIIVWEPPVPKISTSADSTCAVNPVVFRSLSTFKHPIKNYYWNFGEPLIFNDTSTAIVTSWKYTTPFNHSVLLRLTDVNGCSREDIKNVYVFDTAGPQRSEIAYVTVRDDKYVDYYWRKSPLGNYRAYHVYLDSSALYKQTVVYNRKDTLYSWLYGNQVDNRRYCFKIKVEDTCLQIGKESDGHCTIVLRDSIFEPFHGTIKWLAYDWWGGDLNRYEVFRKDPGSSVYKKIADVKNNRQIYTDSFLCAGTYHYYVEAVHENRIYRSRSNEIELIPIYIKPDVIVNTKLVTVVNNDYTQIFWEPHTKYYRDFSYVLQRSVSGAPGTFNRITEVTTTNATDPTANIHSLVNFYNIRFKDHCGVEAEEGSSSNSILLQTASQNRNNTSLVWNKYNYWYSGVKSYGIQLKNQFNQFVTISSTPGSITRADSLDIEKFGLDSICFRVFAVKDSITADTSYSNEVCLVPSSYIHIANSFSPDDNNLNEVFKPVFGFIHRNSNDPKTRYEFEIYDRWGQKVFSTNNPDEGWDGKINGVLAPYGHFIYTVKAVGYDGIPYRLNGTVFLLR